MRTHSSEDSADVGAIGLALYGGYSKVRTHTALGSYSRPIPRSIGPPWGRCVPLIASTPCSHWSDRLVIRENSSAVQWLLDEEEDGWEDCEGRGV